MFLEHVEVYELFGRTKWTQNLRWEDQNRLQGPGSSSSPVEFPVVFDAISHGAHNSWVGGGEWGGAINYIIAITKDAWTQTSWKPKEWGRQTYR